MIDRRTFIGSVAGGLLAMPLGAFAQAQQARVYRVGVVHEGGPYNVGVDGLKEGLRELGFAEGKDYVLDVRDLKGGTGCSLISGLVMQAEACGP